ncbi:MAG: hypothetical protein MJ071_02370 [Oscillospiraceae bacterium]|nr:hypothetical protein [Oscillospiraceae bacterium]
MRVETMIEAIGMIDDDMILEARKVRLKKPVQRRNRIAAMLSVAAAAACLTAGVCANVGRDSDLLNQWFGAEGEQSVSQDNLPAPIVFENENMRVILETEIDDGIAHLALLSFENLDGTPFEQYVSSGMYTMYVTENGEMSNTLRSSAFGFRYKADNEIPAPGCLAAIVDYDSTLIEPTYMTFVQMGATEQITPNLLEGIRIPLHFGKNTGLLSFEAENDIQFRLSCFELECICPGEEYETMESSLWNNKPVLILNDGTRKILDARGSGAGPLSDDSGYWRISFTGFDYQDISQVAALEYRGRVYPVSRLD